MTLVEATLRASLTEIAAWTVRDVDHLCDVRAQLQQRLTAAVDADEGRQEGRGLDRIVLVASELATNAVRYGSRPVTLRLLQQGSTFAVDVVDHRPDAPPVEGTSGAGGRGLVVAARAAAAVGWFRTRSTKHVWARFA